MNDFEKQIHAMFDHIWDCNIDHPVFKDTVGDLMAAVIQCHKGLTSAEPVSVIRCKDCRYYKTYQYVNGRPKFLPRCGFNDIYVTDEDFCSRAERRN